MLSQQQLEAEISRLVAEQPNIFSSEMAEIINNRYGTNYSSNNIVNISNDLDKVSKETLIAIFHEFQRYETDFAIISQRTGVPQARVRKEILKVMVNNVYRVCIIVRKRSISKLVKNFLSQKSIHSLALLIVKPSNFRSVKAEYSLLWNFIARFHEEAFFKTVSDENYKLIYRQLIILAEAYKVSQDFEDNGGVLGFERITLQQSGINDPFALLKDFKKKNCQQTIDLISDDEQQPAGDIQEEKRAVEPEQNKQQRKESEPTSNIMAMLEKPIQRGQLEGGRFLAELLTLYSRMSKLQQQSKQGTQNLNDQMAQLALKICTIEFLIGVN